MKKLTGDQESLKNLLKDTITLLCKNGLHFQEEVSVEALIGITLDHDNVFLVNIKETVPSSLKSGTGLESNDPEPDALSGNKSEDEVILVKDPKYNRSKKRLSYSDVEHSIPLKRERLDLDDSEAEEASECLIDVKPAHEVMNDTSFAMEQALMQEGLAQTQLSYHPLSANVSMVSQSGHSGDVSMVSKSGGVSMMSQSDKPTEPKPLLVTAMSPAEHTYATGSASATPQTGTTPGQPATSSSHQTPEKNTKMNNRRPSGGYRKYTDEQMKEAMKLCKRGVPVDRVAKLTGIPGNTIRRRTKGQVAVDCKQGRPHLFKPEEEEALIQALRTADDGEGYTRKQLLDLLSDTAKQLKKRPSSEKPLGYSWLDSFISRHPEVKALQRKKPTSTQQQGKSVPALKIKKSKVIDDCKDSSQGKLICTYYSLNL